MRAFVAPQSWATLSTQSETNIDSDEYDLLLWAARPTLQEMPSTKMELPIKVAQPKVKKMSVPLQSYNLHHLCRKKKNKLLFNIITLVVSE